MENAEIQSTIIQAIYRNDCFTLMKYLDKLQTKNDPMFAFLDCDKTKNNPQMILPDNFVTLLHIAAAKNSLECFCFLEENSKLSIYSKSAACYYPLHYSCLSGASEVTFYIFEKMSGNTNIVIEPPHPSNYSLIDLVVIDGNSAILNELFKYGAVLNKDKQYATFLLAINKFHYDCLTTLLHHVHAYNRKSDSYSFISWAAIANLNSKVFRLLYTGPQELCSFPPPEKNRSRCLIELMIGYDPKYFKDVLLEILPNAKNYCLEPPYTVRGVCHWACIIGDLEIAKLLFQTQKVLPNRVDSIGDTGPCSCADNNYLSDEQIINMIDFIITQGYLINGNYNTVLECYTSSIMKRYRVVKYLLEKGANPYVELQRKPSSSYLTLYESVMNSRDEKMKELFKTYGKTQVNDDN